jgi:FkbM family methyltransferase
LIIRSFQGLNPDRYVYSDIKVLCASVSDSNRISELEVAERGRASNHLAEAIGSTQAKGTRYVQPTVSLTLDFLLDYFPAPSVLKIDVETHENAVLKGAAQLLKEVRPTIWCEVSPQNSEELTNLLHGANYELYGAETKPHQHTNRAWFHTLAIPSPR